MNVLKTAPAPPAATQNGPQHPRPRDCPPRSGAQLVSPGPPRTRAVLDTVIRAGTSLGVWGGLLLVTAWWATGGGLQDLGALDGALTSLGRWAGLVASDLLLVQILLIARIPAVERAWGQDRLVGIHRLVGFTSFWLMVTHIALITGGYAGGAVLQAPATLWGLTRDYPGMLLAVAGTGCLLAATVSSIRAARRRMRYESWHLLHLYAYLGAGLVLPHQLWTGADFLESPGATTYWWALWALAAAAVLAFRVVRPAITSWRHRLRVTSVVPEGDRTWSVYVSGGSMGRLRAEAGQFLVWRFRTGRGWTRGHPYSLSAAPDGRSLRLSVKTLGDDSAEVRHLRPGTRVLVEGPYGRMSARARTRSKVLLIGAGIGLAPIRALAEGLDYAGNDAMVIARSSGERPIFADEWETLAEERGLRMIWLTGPRSADGSFRPVAAQPHGGLTGDITHDDATALTSWVPDIAERDVFVCGPDDWTAAVRRAALAAGLPPSQFHLELFSW